MIGGCGSKGMGTKLQIDNYLPGHCSMRDLSRESNGASWPSCYGDSNLSNGQFYYGFLPRTVADSHPRYDKDVVKQTMLEHEAIFKKQVRELHRLYQVQRDLMDEIRRKEQFKRRIPYEASSSSSPVPSQLQCEDVQRWNGPRLPLANSLCCRPPISGPDTIQSSPHSTKGKSIRAGPSPSPFRNCYSPNNSEVSESRPTKSRRRMLDLQLPADEYIDPDEVEQFDDAKVSDNIRRSPDKNGNFASENNGKLFLNYPGRFDSHASKPKALADLNEPLHVEEITAVSSVDFLGCGVSHGDVQYTDPSTKFLSPSKYVPQDSHHGSLNGNWNNIPFENRPNGQDWFCYALQSEQDKSSLRSINKGTPPTPSQPIQSMLDQASQPPAFRTCDRIKGDPWGAKSVGNIEKFDTNYSLPSYNLPEPILSSHVPNQPTLFHPSDLGKLSDQCPSTWGKPRSVQSSPYLNSATSSKSPRSSAQSNGLFGNKWNLNSIPGANAGFGGEPPMRNGFYHGSSASSKEVPVRFPPVGFDYISCNNSDKTLPCSSNSYFKAATDTDVKPVIDMNLNVPLPEEDPFVVLPWLRGKTACTNEAENSRKGPNPLEPILSRGPSFGSSSYDGDVKAKKHESSRKILGVPIFGNPPTPKKEHATVISPSAIHHQGRKGGFDMNVPCEPIESELDDMAVEVVAVVEKKIQNESASLRNHHFDLNSCITEEEDPCGTSLPENSARMKGGTGIDLEAPVMLESEEEEDPLIKESEMQPTLPPDIADDGGAELAKSAAEIIVVISSSVVNQNQSEVVEASCPPVEDSEEEVLRWFVDIACCSRNDLENDEGLDDFELMTLRLKECDVEEYFPKPSIPEIPNIEENGARFLTTRTRKGQARRGRQRRDFQRDILPGLVSLSRHEVTEDLQTFGGLMRATGHPWHSGPNRRNATRNGCGRGRRRSMVVAHAPANTVCAPSKQQQIIPSSNTEVGLEDRSLTGWGKTTRRPRRQRCPAGNPPPPLPLS